MYIAIGIFYVLVMVFVIFLPFYKMAQARKLAESCLGQVIEGKYDIHKVCKNILLKFHAIKREAAVIIFLDEKNKCIDVKVKFGTKEFLKNQIKKICEKAPNLKASSIIVACNHRIENKSPDRSDILNAATLYSSLPDGISLGGYIVWCTNQAISLLDSYEFKQMISRYG